MCSVKIEFARTRKYKEFLQSFRAPDTNGRQSPLLYHRHILFHGGAQQNMMADTKPKQSWLSSDFWNNRHMVSMTWGKMDIKRTYLGGAWNGDVIQATWPLIRKLIFRLDTVYLYLVKLETNVQYASRTNENSIKYL